MPHKQAELKTTEITFLLVLGGEMSKIKAWAGPYSFGGLEAEGLFPSPWASRCASSPGLAVDTSLWSLRMSAVLVGLLVCLCAHENNSHIDLGPAPTEYDFILSFFFFLMVFWSRHMACTDLSSQARD